MTSPQTLAGDDTARAIEASEAWLDDYLDRHAPTAERLQRALAQHAIAQLRLALGPRHGQRAAAQVLAILATAPPDEETCDRIAAGDITLLQDDSLDIDWADLSAELAHLFAYARYGYGQRLDPDASRTEIEALLAHLRQAAANAGLRAAAGPDFDWLAETMAAAEARWALDHGRPVAPAEFAALAGVRPKTIANLLAARELTSDAEGRIPAAEAMRYLERRDGFVRSTWQHPTPPAADPADPDAPLLAEQVFVPVDSDGNPFLPSVARRGRDGIPRYAIGAKNAPDYVEDYWEALDQLARMPTPRWRRPPVSGKGGWSLVSGQDGWRRFARADLERMVAAAQADGDERLPA